METRFHLYRRTDQLWLRAVGVVSDPGLQIRSLLKRLGVRFSLRAAKLPEHLADEEVWYTFLFL